MSRSVRFVFVFVTAMLCALTSGCSLITSSDCVSIGVSGLRVSVVDARTNQIPAGAVVTAADGAYQETLRWDGAAFYGASERPGSYIITVEAPGYARWTRSNVGVVRRGECNYLQQVTLSSELQPAS